MYKAPYYTFVAAVVAGLACLLIHAEEGGGSKSKVLLKASSSWNNIPYKSYPAGMPELTTIRMTIPAHSRLNWHKHPMPNVAFIVSGQLTIEERGTGRKGTYKAGESFAESVDNVHRGITGASPTVVLVTYAGTAGQPLSIPVTDGK